MRSKFISGLGSVQAFLLMAKGLLYLAGVDFPWVFALIPLWILLFIAVVFWGIFGALVSKFSS